MFWKRHPFPKKENHGFLTLIEVHTDSIRRIIVDQCLSSLVKGNQLNESVDLTLRSINRSTDEGAGSDRSTDGSIDPLRSSNKEHCSFRICRESTLLKNKDVFDNMVIAYH